MRRDCQCVPRACGTTKVNYLVTSHHTSITKAILFSESVNMLGDKLTPGFVQTLESPGIKMLRFPGLESPGKRHRSWKTLEKSWNSKLVVLEILISGTSIAN